MIVKKQTFEHFTVTIHDELHWLPVGQRIILKLCLFAYKYQRQLVSTYDTLMCSLLVSNTAHQGCSLGLGHLTLHAFFGTSQSHLDTFTPTTRSCLGLGAILSHLQPCACRHRRSAACGVLEIYTAEPMDMSTLLCFLEHLPTSLKSSSLSPNQFHRQLKTFLFTQYTVTDW